MDPGRRLLRHTTRPLAVLEDAGLQTLLQHRVTLGAEVGSVARLADALALGIYGGAPALVSVDGVDELPGQTEGHVDVTLIKTVGSGLRSTILAGLREGDGDGLLSRYDLRLGSLHSLLGRRERDTVALH